MNSAAPHFDACVVGAGVIGLAIGRALAQRGQQVILLEQHPLIGSETSSRNSEVIHAGIYYPTDSLKARLCVAGKQALYAYCEQKSIPHRRIGKLIVAQAGQSEPLRALQAQASANGVTDLVWLDRAELQRREPNVRGECALLSPSTGIVDSHTFMQQLSLEIEKYGGMIATNTRFLGAQQSTDGYRIDTQSAGEPYTFTSRTLINSAGLHAPEVAQRIQGLPSTAIPRLHYCKGHYFSLLGRTPFQHLIYPLPEPGTTGLGIHATLDLQGRARFGPDTQYIEHPDYRVPDTLAEGFARAIATYWPDITPERLSPAYAGVRPKLQGRGEPAQDFRIDHPLPGLINLFGLESPGLTAALAIGDHVRDLLTP